MKVESLQTTEEQALERYEKQVVEFWKWYGDTFNNPDEHKNPAYWGVEDGMIKINVRQAAHLLDKHKKQFGLSLLREDLIQLGEVIKANGIVITEKKGFRHYFTPQSFHAYIRLAQTFDQLKKENKIAGNIKVPSQFVPIMNDIGVRFAQDNIACTPLVRRVNSQFMKKP